MSTQPFAHSPLQSTSHIRLIRLQAGKSDEDIACTIFQTSLDDAPAFEAISYTWGAVDDRQRLVCSSGGEFMEVTKNCNSVLRRLRDDNEPRIIWVDAICIDQDNIEERNAQVAIMGQIYQRASHVIIDIGEASKDSDLALDAITHCSDTGLYSFELGLEIRDAVNALYRRPWFNRVWVLQEAFMSKEATVLCGTRLVPWSIFRPRRIWVDSRPAHELEPWHVKLPASIPHIVTIGKHQSHTYTTRKDLLDLLCKGRTCAATDPRDIVFALLSMLPDARMEGIQADYNKDKAQVYTEVAASLLKYFGLDFLPCVHNQAPTNGLPSWVPDWSQRVREQWLIGRGVAYYPVSASGKTSVVAEVSFAPDRTMAELKVRGLAVDTICATSQDINIRTDSSSLHEFISERREYARRHPESEVPLPENRAWTPRSLETRLHPPSWMLQYGLPLAHPEAETDNNMADLITFFCSGRKLVQTERGYVGLAPEEARVGDVVCCFLGAGVPYVLRETGPGLSYFLRKTRDGPGVVKVGNCTLIGEGYFWGLMTGEAFAGIDVSDMTEHEAQAPLQDIHIC
jgi:hypothetical protein